MARRQYRILEIMSRHDEGRYIEDADELLGRAVREVIRYGGKGKVSLEIEIKPNGDRGISLNPSVKHSLPKRQQSDAFYFPDADGDLFRDPPADEADEMLREVKT